MSRSYKKAILKYAGDTHLKEIYNRNLRKECNVPNGGSYRKYNQTWEIFDVRQDMRYSEEKTLQNLKKKMFKNIGKHQSWKIKK